MGGKCQRTSDRFRQCETHDPYLSDSSNSPASLLPTLQVPQPSEELYAAPHHVIDSSWGGGLICVGGVWCIRVKITNLSRQQSGWKTPQHRKRKRKNTQPSSSSLSSLTRLNTCTGELTASFLPCVLFFIVKMCLFVFCLNRIWRLLWLKFSSVTGSFYDVISCCHHINNTQTSKCTMCKQVYDHNIWFFFCCLD